MQNPTEEEVKVSPVVAPKALSEGEVSDFEFGDSSSSSCTSTDTSIAEEEEEERKEEQEDHSLTTLPVEETIEPFDAKSVPINANYLPVGQVISDLQNLLIIKTSSGEERVLQVGSVIFDAQHSPIGRISDIWGPVKDPLYSVTKFDNRSTESEKIESRTDDTSKTSESIGIKNSDECKNEMKSTKEELEDIVSCENKTEEELQNSNICETQIAKAENSQELNFDSEKAEFLGVNAEKSDLKDEEPVLKCTTPPIVGQTVYYIPDLAEVVLTAPLKALKGTDASNLYDQEAETPEFSDDEEERAYKMSLKKSSQKDLSQLNNIADKTSNKNPKKRMASSNIQGNHHQKQSVFDNRQHKNQHPHKPVQNYSGKPTVYGNIRPPVFVQPVAQRAATYGEQRQMHFPHQGQPRAYKSSLQMEAQTKLLAQIQASQYHSQMQQIMANSSNQSLRNLNSFPLPAQVQLQTQAYNQFATQQQSRPYQQPRDSPQQHPNAFPFNESAKNTHNASGFPFSYQQPQYQQPIQPPVHQQFQQPLQQSSPQYFSDLPSAYSSQFSQLPSQSVYSRNHSQPSGHQTKPPRALHQIPTPQPSPVPQMSEEQRQQLEQLARFLQN